MCPGSEGGTFFLCQASGDKQYCISSYDTCLEQLVFVDDEILSQDRNADQWACHAYILQRTAKEFFVRKDRDCGSTGCFVCSGYFFGTGSLVYPSFRRRTAFEFGNDSRGGRSKRLFHAADRYGDGSSGSGVFLHHGGNLFLQPFEGDGLLLQFYFNSFMSDDFR